MWDRIYNRTWSPLHEWAQPVLYDRQTTNTVSYDRHRPIRFKHEVYMVICDFYIFSVESSKICVAKPSKRVNFISKHTRMCDNASITRTKVYLEPYLEPYNNRMKIDLQTVFNPWQTLLDREYPCFVRTYSCYIRVSIVPTHPQARLEHYTRTSQPVYNRVYRIGTVCPTVFSVRQALITFRI